MSFSKGTREVCSPKRGSSVTSRVLSPPRPSSVASIHHHQQQQPSSDTVTVATAPITSTAHAATTASADDSRCELDHHSRSDTRFHPHLSSSLLRVEYGPKYKEPAVLIGPNSPTRRLSRPTSPQRMERYQLQHQADTIAALQHQAYQQQLLLHPGQLSDGYESPNRVAPTPTPRDANGSLLQPPSVDALSQQLEFDMHLLAQLKSERDALSGKFDSLMSQIDEDQRAAEASGSATSADFHASAEELQKQFREQLEKYDARIFQLQNAISESAKQMALGYQQQQQQQQQAARPQQQHPPRRVSFSPERKTASSVIAPGSPRSHHSSQPTINTPFSLPAELNPAQLFEAYQFEQALPPHLQKAWSQLRATFIQRVSARDAQVVHAAEARVRPLLADSQRHTDSTNQAWERSQAELQQREKELEQLRSEVLHVRTELSESEERRKDLTRLYEKAQADRTALRAKNEQSLEAMAQAQVETESVNKQASEDEGKQNAVVASLLSKLSTERAKYEDVYATLLRSKRQLEEQSQTDSVTIQSLRAQLSHELATNKTERRTLADSFKAESQELNQRLKDAEEKSKELQTQLQEAQAAKSDLQSQLSALNTATDQAQQIAKESTGKVEVLEAAKDALTERLEAAMNRSTAESLEALNLRSEQLKWNSDKEKLETRLMDELRNVDQMSRLLQAQMDAARAATEEAETEREGRYKAENERDEAREALTQRDNAIRAAQAKAHEAAQGKAEAETNAQKVEIDAQEAAQQFELHLASAKAALRKAEHEARLAREETNGEQQRANDAAAESEALRKELKTREDEVRHSRSEQTQLLSTQKTLDAEVRRALDQLRMVAKSKGEQEQTVRDLEKRARNAENLLQAEKDSGAAALDNQRREYEQQLNELRISSRAEAVQAREAYDALNARLKAAHQLQENMAAAAQGFSEMMAKQRRLVASPAASGASFAASSSSTAPRATSPIRSSPTTKRSQTQASPPHTTYSSRTAATAPTPIPSFVSRTSATPSSASVAAAPPAITVTAPAAAPAPVLTTASSTSSFSSRAIGDSEMLAQLAELKALRESLSNDPLLQSYSSTSSRHRVLSPPRASYSSSLHASTSLRSPSFSPSRSGNAGFSIRSPLRTTRSELERLVNDGEVTVTEQGAIISQHVIPASTVTTTITPLQRSPARLR